MLNEKKLETLKQYLQRCVEDGTFPGCNCAVITKDDKWTCSVGYKQLVPEKEVTAWIQSMTWRRYPRCSSRRPAFSS